MDDPEDRRVKSEVEKADQGGSTNCQLSSFDFWRSTALQRNLFLGTKPRGY